MKSTYKYLPFILGVFAFISACEDVISPELPNSEPVVSIDAFVTNKQEVQVIKVFKTEPYFNTTIPPVSGAQVTVTDQNGTVFNFTEGTTAGWYEWDPAQNDSQLGVPGVTYNLEVIAEGVEYTATTTTGRVPVIDSLAFYFEPEGLLPESWFAELWARDPVGLGDAYWIKGWKNGSYLNKPDEILLAYDAGFSRGSQIDGLIFIPPVRRGTGINPSFEEDENGEFLPAYVEGDSAYVEIHSISGDTFDFLTNVAIQINRSEGFGELFAQPLSNVPTNITPSEEGKFVVGFFNVSAVSSAGKRLVVD